MVAFLVAIIVIAADIAILSMCASGIELALKSKYDDKKRALDEREQMLEEAAREFAMELYMDALRRTHIEYRAKIEVVDDPLGKKEAV